MSGQQLGTAVGFVAGFFLPGGPMLWASIGGMIGGAIDPTEMHGPRIGEGANQSSAEGVPIAWVMGTCGWIQGNIVQVSARREVKKEDDGKGGPVTVTYEAHQDFCILICESSETRDSLMAGVLIAKINGKIVYDMRPDKNFAAENSKFLQNHRFYNGHEAQLPDPTMEAITGVGNTPAYRGVFTMVAVDINLSQYGDAIPTYEFVMSQEAVTEEIPPVLSAGMLAPFVNEPFPMDGPASAYTYTGNRENYGPPFSADTIAEVQAHFSGMRPCDVYLGYSAFRPVDDLAFASGETYSAVDTQPSVVDNEDVTLVYNETLPTSFVDAEAETFCAVIPYGGPDEVSAVSGDRQGRTVFLESDNTTDWSALEYTSWGNCTSMPPNGGLFPAVWGTWPLYITVRRKRVAPIFELPEGAMVVPDAPEYYSNPDGSLEFIPTYEELSGTYKVLSLQEYWDDEAGSFRQLDYYPQGPVLESADPLYSDEAFWTDAYDAAVIAGDLPAGWTYGADYPIVVDTVYEELPEAGTLTPGAIPLADAITRICERGGLTTADIDVTDIDQELLGYMIAQPHNGADSLRPLMTAFVSYASEYDAKLHFHKMGEDIEVIVDPDDFIEGTDVTDESMREQAVELPKLVSVTAIDPTQDYTARPQSERRTSPDIRARGEQTTQVPVVLPPDQHRQLAAIGMKAAWARADGTREFSVPYAQSDVYLSLTPGQPFALDGKRYIASKMRLEDGEIHVEAVRDRQSAYTSNVTATPALPPDAPPSNIYGATLFAAMNLPSLRSQDNVPGMYMAACGMLASWPGCVLQMSIDDGANWTTAIGSMTQPSVIGYLTADLAAHAAGEDVTNTLSVAVKGGELNAVAGVYIEDGSNACAVFGADNIAEILQFRDAVEGDPNEYDLDTLYRGVLSTTPQAHVAGDRFVRLNAPYFLPIDPAFAGRTILFRPVTFGSNPELNTTYSIVYEPPTFVFDGGHA